MTYSIVARDPITGEIGVAVQSHFFSVGPVVPWAMAGVGAVATQATAEVSFGPRGLALLRGGLDAAGGLERLLSADPSARERQVAIVDAAGNVAAYTGVGCIPEAGHLTGTAVSCQGNIMASRDVWPAMLDAFESSGGTLVERLLVALDAAELAGGDLRGRQSAAILVVPAEGEEWQTSISLRVEDHPEPLGELRRLVELHGAYELAFRADALIHRGHPEQAALLLRQARERAPGNHELLFWSGLAAADRGELDEALAAVREAIAMQGGWGIVLRRLTPEVAPSAAVVLEMLTRET